MLKFSLQNSLQGFESLFIKYISYSYIVIHICIRCILHKNYIRLHFYTLCHIKEKCVEFFFFIIFFFFCSLNKVKIHLDVSDINHKINYDALELENEYFVRTFCRWKTCLKRKFQENSSKSTSVEKKWIISRDFNTPFKSSYWRIFLKISKISRVLRKHLFGVCF